MLSKKQAEAAGEALLQPNREELAQRAAKHAAFQRVVAARRRHQLIGFVIGGCIGVVIYYFFGKSPIPIIAGPALGSLAVAVVGVRKAQQGVGNSGGVI